MNNTFLFDSYAFFEILKANPNYSKYKESNILTTKLNLFELYQGLLRETSEDLAFQSLDKYFDFIVDFDKEVMKEAAKFKIAHSKRKLSMADCIGYILSMKLEIKFLTGDKEFENFPNVEFVK